MASTVPAGSRGPSGLRSGDFGDGLKIEMERVTPALFDPLAPPDGTPFQPLAEARALNRKTFLTLILCGFVIF